MATAEKMSDDLQTEARKLGVALIAADELAGVLETAHLLRSPANAERLLTALARVRQGYGIPQSVAELRHEIGIDKT